jgi:hypothetical protein
METAKIILALTAIAVLAIIAYSGDDVLDKHAKK